ncbi:glycosyltransferase [Cylindrospermum stagnale PCC 7417]|uniref:Glycosyltransferase n=1 Tax=Cylindrospermum stagnale PCC 7417 TaxID=56107 RepID=K9WRQ2_9NOST|nr:glycosyltransferase family 4 protein [Cylindrospermum stagnale]AFZ22464.1 glycosyltransferase [Cylindrospermum stagnale PCC 7417]
MKLKIAIVVHGRFHAFDLARELIKQGNDVTLFTNYPKNIVEKFGINKKHVKSFLIHGIFARISGKVQRILDQVNLEALLHTKFSSWATQIIVKQEYDVVYAFSGVAEEIFQALSNKHVLKAVVRGSAHIRTQFQILSAEEKRARVSVDKPSNWIIAREEREYQISDLVIVLSTFAKRSFIDQGIVQEKLKVLPLGTQLEKFYPVRQVIKERCHRISSKNPLRVLMVGTYSYRKGAIDFSKIAELGGNHFQFKFVGNVNSEVSQLVQNSSGNIEFIPKQPQYELPEFYAWADIFIFTTIEDGYAVVLAQAQAAGIPILSTTNCASLDIVVEGETGWILPIRSPESFVERLMWCDQHRQDLVQMVWRIYQNFQPRDWAEVAADFVDISYTEISKKLEV